ncbi:hypothetical protein C1645_667690, partial [Glomus cerebriforme]
LEPPTIKPACGGKGDPECPIKAGTEFTLKAEVPTPAKLPSSYGIGVAIGNPTG